MNGWRATKCGGALTIFIDATYKLVVEGHGTIGIFVVDESQKSHLLGLVIVNKEDHHTIAHCVRQIKVGVETAVQIYSRIGLSAWSNINVADGRNAKVKIKRFLLTSRLALALFVWRLYFFIF